MKKTALLVIIALIVVVISGYGVYRSVHNVPPPPDVTLANVEVLAEGEDSNVDCGPESFDNHILTLKNCFPLFWQQKLIGKPYSGKCCVSVTQAPCKGSGLVTISLDP